MRLVYILLIAAASFSNISFKDVEVGSNKAVYEVGEVVEFYIKNTLDINIEATFTYVIKDDLGRVVASPAFAMFIEILEPGDTKILYWNQHDNNDKQVPAGNYTANIKFGREEFEVKFRIL